MKFSNGNKKSSTYTQHDTDGNIRMNLLFVLWTRDGVFSLWGTALWGRAADTEQLGLVRSTLGWNHCCTFSWGLQSGPSASGWARPSAAAAGWPWAWCQSPFWQRSDWSVAPPGPWWSCGGANMTTVRQLRLHQMRERAFGRVIGSTEDVFHPFFICMCDCWLEKEKKANGVCLESFWWSSDIMAQCVRYSLGVLLQGRVVHQGAELFGHPVLQLLKVTADIWEIGRLLCKASCGQFQKHTKHHTFSSHTTDCECCATAVTVPWARASTTAATKSVSFMAAEWRGPAGHTVAL